MNPELRLSTFVKIPPQKIHDMYSLITEKNLDISSLRSEIDQKMKFKGAPFEQRQGEFDKKELRLKKNMGNQAFKANDLTSRI